MRRFVLLILLQLSAAFVLGAGNLVKNGDFSELYPNGRPVYWGKLDAGLELVPAPSGKGRALHIRKNSGSSLCQYDIRVKGGKNYKVTYMLKTDFPKWLSAASFQILWFGKDGKPLFVDYKGKQVWNMTIKNIQGTRDWTRMEIPECTAPAGAAGARIGLSIAFDKEGECWFADIRMTEQKQGDAFDNRIASLPFAAADPADSELLEEKHWKNSAALNDFLIATTNTRVTNPTEARVFYTAKAIYVNVKCMVPQAKKLKLNKKVMFGMQESSEVFLRPPEIAHQYQIVVNPEGDLYCFTETWNDGSWPLKCNPWKDSGVVCRTARGDNYWQYALKIPFAGLNQKTPADGAAWRMNICRANYTAKPRELAAWSALKEAHFQYPGDFGKVYFRKSIPLIRTIHTDVNGAAMQIFNPLDKDAEIQASFLKQTEKGSSLIAETVFRIAAGQERDFTWNCPTKNADMRFLELRWGDRLLAKHCNRPTEEFYSMGIFDPEGVRGKVLNIAVDHPFFLGLNLRHNAKGRTTHRIIDRQDRAFDLYMEMPEEMAIRGMMFDAGEWRQSNLIRPEKVSFVRNGRKMIRYKFEMPYIINWESPAYMFFYECGLKAGEEFSGAYYFTVDGRELPHNEMSFRTMKIGSMKKPLKKFGHDMFYLDAKVLRNLFPENTLKHYAALGMNRITVNTREQKNAELFAGNNPRKREDYYDLLFREMKETGIRMFFTSNSSSATPMAWYWTDKDRDARAIGADGKDAPFNQYGYPALCPTYRGTHFQKHAAMLRDSYLFHKYKCTWLTLDLELWPKTVWDKLCFCPRCLQDFRKFAEKNGPEWADCNVRQKFSEGKDKAFMDFWNRYKGYAHQQFILDLTAPVKNASSRDYSKAFRNRFLIGEWCRPRAHLMDIIDYFELGLYYTPDVVYGHFRDMYRQWGDAKKNWYPTFTFGQTSACPDFHMKAEQLPELIYEAAIFGGQGICWYYYAFIEPLRLSKVIQGVSTIQPVEDLVVDGRIISSVAIGNPAMQLTARRNGSEGLIAVRAYKSSRAQTGRVSFADLKAPAAVYDCISGKKIAQVTPAAPYFDYTVQAGRCRLLYFGTDVQWNNRHK